MQKRYEIIIMAISVGGRTQACYSRHLLVNVFFYSNEVNIFLEKSINDNYSNGLANSSGIVRSNFMKHNTTGLHLIPSY